MKRRGATEWVVVALLVGFTALAVGKQIQFSLSQGEPFGRDWDFHLQMAQVIQGCHFSYEQMISWYRKDESGSVHYPPLFYLLAALVAAVDDVPVMESVYLSLSLWIVVLSASVYAAGRKLGGNCWTGLAASAISGLNFLLIHTESYDLNLDFPAAVAVAACTCAFYTTRDLLRGRESVLLGIACGLAVLTKVTVLVYLLPFLFVALLLPLQGRVGDFGLRIRNAGICLASAAGLVGWYVLPLLPRFIEKLSMESGAVHWDDMVLNAERYSRLFATFLPWTFLFALGAIPAALLVRRRDRAVVPYLVASATACLFFAKMRMVALGYFFPLHVWSGILWARVMAPWSLRASRAMSVLLAVCFVLPLVFSRPGGWQRGLGFDPETQRYISELAARLSGFGERLEADKVGYLVPDNGAALTIRRGVFGSAVALAKPGEVWSDLLASTGERIAYLCQDELQSERLGRVLSLPAVLTIIPAEPPPGGGGCEERIHTVSRFLDESYQRKYETLYRFFAGAGTPTATGFRTHYYLRLYLKDETH